MSDHYISFKCDSKNVDSIVEQVESLGGEVLYSSTVSTRLTGPKYADDLYEKVLSVVHSAKTPIAFGDIEKKRFKSEYGFVYSPHTIRAVLYQLIRLGKAHKDDKGRVYTDKPQAIAPTSTIVLSDNKLKNAVLAFIQTKCKRKAGAAKAAEIMSFVESKKFSGRWGYKIINQMLDEGLIKKVSYGKYST